MRALYAHWDAFRTRRWVWLIVAGVLAGSAYLASRATPSWLIAVAAISSLFVLLKHPAIGLLGIILLALLLPVEISTGTEVRLNLVTFSVPALFAVSLVDRIWRRYSALVPSRTSKPLVLFLGAALFSLLVGNVTWDPVVPKSSHFLLVQLAQWAIFAFSAFAFWVMASLIENETWLSRVTWCLVAVAGGMVLLRSLPFSRSWIGGVTTVAFIRAPFWICLVALAGGQFLFHRQLSMWSRLALAGTVLLALYYGLVTGRESISTWTPVLLVLGMLSWLRFSHLRWPMLVVALAALLLFFPALYEFAGGNAEWILAGAPRFELMRRVIEVTMHNPVFGLGPASYRAYARVAPLRYRQAFWLDPNVSSHNNYVDIFAHSGLLGLGLFTWFLVELGRLGWRLSQRYREGFIGGYVNGMLAAFVALLFAMLRADWFLPFVYNIGFPGFQASVLAWMFLGGLVAVDHFEEADGVVDRGRQLEHT